MTKPRCFGNFLLYSASICLSCRVWRECQREGGKYAEV